MLSKPCSHNRSDRKPNASPQAKSTASCTYRAQIEVAPNQFPIIPFKAAIEFRNFDQFGHAAGNLSSVSQRLISR